MLLRIVFKDQIVIDSTAQIVYKFEHCEISFIGEMMFYAMVLIIHFNSWLLYVQKYISKYNLITCIKRV